MTLSREQRSESQGTRTSLFCLYLATSFSCDSWWAEAHTGDKVLLRHWGPGDPSHLYSPVLHHTRNNSFSLNSLPENCINEYAHTMWVTGRCMCAKRVCLKLMYDCFFPLCVFLESSVTEKITPRYTMFNWIFSFLHKHITLSWNYRHTLVVVV